jgi:predicted transcriptional regulator of viral defense system
MVAAMDEPTKTPDWEALFECAQAQSGYFTTAQAAQVGFSRPLLHKYLANGTIRRIRRGIYRLVHFPYSQDEELVIPWLWAEQEGVFSHVTALALQDLSDALPSKIHMTVPASWHFRRLRVPAGIVLHFADIPGAERTYFGAVQITSPSRTLLDCIEGYVDPDLVYQAITQASRRGLISRTEKDVFSSLLDRTLAPAQ